MNVTQGGASLKQSQRDSEELKENGETASGDMQQELSHR